MLKGNFFNDKTNLKIPHDFYEHLPVLFASE